MSEADSSLPNKRECSTPRTWLSCLLDSTPLSSSFWKPGFPRGGDGDVSDWHFVPEYTEHPKPKRRKSLESRPPSNNPQEPPPQQPGDDVVGDGEVTFFQDFVAGGMAGCASVVVGHPFDTVKVRLQSSSGQGNLLKALSEFGGVSSLYRGMGAPLSFATGINAIVFSSYGLASKTYDEYLLSNDDNVIIDENNIDTLVELNHDPWQKSMTCGAFAGFVQCFIICPVEHVKCRLQVQRGATGAAYRGPMQAVRSILQDHGLARLYQGWWTTLWREVPAFATYFASYDMIKDKANSYFAKRAAQAGTLQNVGPDPLGLGHSHTWLASAIAGGCAGSLTWALVYPLDVLKTRIQTAALDTPRTELQMWRVGTALVQKNGWQCLFRGFGVTILRAFPVNATVFPVYEFTLLQLQRWE